VCDLKLVFVCLKSFNDQILDDGQAFRRARFVFLHRGRDDSAADLTTNFSLFAEEMHGLVVAAAVDCALLTTTAVCNTFSAAGLKLPSLRLLPPSAYTAAPKGSHRPPGIAVPAQLDALRELVPRLFASHSVKSLSPNSLHAFLGRKGKPTSRAILFTEKASVPVVWRAVSSRPMHSWICSESARLETFHPTDYNQTFKKKFESP
jgi:hypothetical protein